MHAAAPAPACLVTGDGAPTGPPVVGATMWRPAETVVLPAVDAFDAFVTAHQRRLYALAARLTGDPAAADDLVQETFVRAWQALQTGDAPDAPEAWLRRIAVRLYLNTRRGGFARRVVRWCDEAMHGVPDPAPPEPEPTFEAALARALARLSERERAAFVLRHIDDRSTRETADALGVSDGTVKTLLSRAVAKMQVALQSYA